MTRLRRLSFEAFRLPLLEPFGIATGAQHVADNVLVRLELEDGTIGYGEAAPVPHISGECQADVMALESVAERLLEGRDLRDYRPICAEWEQAVGPTRSALAAVEGALFDALTKSRGMSLHQWFGGAEKRLAIDVTVTTGSLGQAQAAAQRYQALGFTSLKIKIGAVDIESDAARVRAVARRAPGTELILDGNTAYTPDSALRLLRELGDVRERVVLFEQPVPREDFEGLREVEAKSGISVAADESLRSREDFLRLLRVGGISAVNIKTAKLGVLAAWDLLVAAHAAGLKVMVGGMVESEISMSTSACLAAGVGGVRYADLDTPLFLGDRPVRSALSPWGPVLHIGRIERGHGASVAAEEP